MVFRAYKFRPVRRGSKCGAAFYAHALRLGARLFRVLSFVIQHALRRLYQILRRRHSHDFLP